MGRRLLDILKVLAALVMLALTLALVAAAGGILLGLAALKIARML